MMKKLKTSKGITLIALVITIIVLLILAGVAISMLSGENGILKQAAEAKTNSDLANLSESIKLTATEILTSKEHKLSEEEFKTKIEQEGYKINEDGTVTQSNVDYALTNKGAVKATIQELKEQQAEMYAKITLVDTNDEQIVIPFGFKIKSDSPTTVKRGIVVVAPDESEFVWVPVIDVTKMATETGETDGNGNKNYQGKLYNFSSTDGVYSAKEKTDYGQGTGKYREPSLVTGNTTETYAVLETVVGTKYDNGTDTTVTPNKKYYEYAGYSSAEEFGKAMQEDYNEMIKSVEKNKGFYVGRYETSLNTTTSYAQSKAGEQSTTAASTNSKYWYGLYQKEKDYSKNNKLTEVVGSSMIWGSQYDQMLIWMQKNGIDVTSKTPTNLEGTTTSKNTGTGSAVGITGIVDTDKLNNIYDLLGNGYDWTLEASSNFMRVRRGGRFSTESSLSTRATLGNSPDYDGDGYSSRLTLYVK